MYPIVNPNAIPGPNPIAAAIQLNISSSFSSTSGVLYCCGGGLRISLLQASSRAGPKSPELFAKEEQDCVRN